MAYKETLERIHSLNKFGSRPGLDRIRKLLELMGNPQDKLRFVHVAGTNGKGSVCAVLSSVLKESGCKTGLFISPYITDFCERIQINNVPVSHSTLCQVADYAFSYVDKLNAEGIIITEFEFVMAVAFECFVREGCQIVVLEVGLGGRLDSTNVIKSPLCCVLTRIGLDHTDILGDTVELIAGEKCGIIKEGTCVVSSPQPKGAKEVVESTCKSLGVPVVFSDSLQLSVLESSMSGTLFEYKGEKMLLPLLGEHQMQNLKTALCALEKLTGKIENITPHSIKAGVETAVNPARFEVLGENPTVIIDGAHNPDGMSTFAQSVRKFFGSTKGVLVMSMLGDKDSRASLEYIEGLFDEVFTVPINNPRAMKSEEMAELCRGYFPKVTPCEDVEDAFLQGLNRAKEKGVHLCVCGSLYLAGEIRPYALKYCSKAQ